MGWQAGSAQARLSSSSSASAGLGRGAEPLSVSQMGGTVFLAACLMLLGLAAHVRDHVAHHVGLGGVQPEEEHSEQVRAGWGGACRESGRRAGGVWRGGGCVLCSLVAKGCLGSFVSGVVLAASTDVVYQRVWDALKREQYCPSMLQWESDSCHVTSTTASSRHCTSIVYKY